MSNGCEADRHPQPWPEMFQLIVAAFASVIAPICKLPYCWKWSLDDHDNLDIFAQTKGLGLDYWDKSRVNILPATDTVKLPGGMAVPVTPLAVLICSAFSVILFSQFWFTNEVLTLIDDLLDESI